MLFKYVHKVDRAVHKRMASVQARCIGHAAPHELTQQDFLRSIKPGFHNVDDFLVYLRKRPQPAFFLAGETPTHIFNIFNRYFPDTQSAVLTRADHVCEHTYDLLGSGPISLGEKINWHMDFKSGYQWKPDHFYADIRPAGYPGGYDIKVPWELSRFQHAIWLGQAYWLTSNEKYAQEFSAQVSNWLIENPWPLGVNWACTMDVAIRAVNWLWGYFFFKDSPSLSDAFRNDFSKSMLVHGRHIWNNLEWSPKLTSNHYLANLVGLVFISLLWPEFKDSKRWREYGFRELEKEMCAQVHPDGVDFEASTSYHRLVTEFFLSTTLLARLHGYAFSSTFMDRLEKMLEFIQHITGPNGTVALIGDNDNGRLHRFQTWNQPEQEWVDYRYLLATGAVLFNRRDFAHAADDQWQEAVWFFGEKALNLFQNTQPEIPRSPLHSQGFPNAGIYILRCQDVHMTVTAGANGQNGMGGHAHNHKLSFSLQVGPDEWVIDPGTFVYTADYDARNIFRSTSFHNTVQVDGLEQIEFAQHNLFTLSPDVPAHVHRWESTEQYDLLDISHAGYSRLEKTVNHRRQIYLHKGSTSYCLIRDLLTGDGSHNLDLFFQVGEAAVKPSAKNFLILEKGKSRLGVCLFSKEPCEAQVEANWRSVGYGRKSKNNVIRFHQETRLPGNFLTVLCWAAFLDECEFKPDNLWASIQSGLAKLQYDHHIPV